MISTPELSPLIVPLKPQTHQQALDLSSRHSTVELGKQVYLNALAVYAVCQFLRWIGIEADLTQAESWNPALCGIWDSADVVLPGVGRLECCTVMPGESEIRLPAEPVEDAIAFVAVQFSDRLEQVQLLGFVPAVDLAEGQVQFAGTQLQPLDDLESYIIRLQQAQDFLVEAQDAVAAQVRQVLANQDLTATIAQLEQIYRTTADRRKWRYAGANILADRHFTMADRELGEISGNANLQRLAHNLMQKLADLWENVNL